MKTRAQKVQEIEQGEKLLKESRNLIFTDFSKTPAENIRSLRSLLKQAGAAFKVIKKRLLKLVLNKSGVDFDPGQFEAQMGTVFAPEDMLGPAGILHKFGKDNKNFQILGGYDIFGKKFVEGEEIIRLGQLPPKEILLAQLVGMIAVPIKQFLYVLRQKAEKVV